MRLVRGSLKTKEQVDAVGKVLLLSLIKWMISGRSNPIGGMVGDPVTNASTEEGVRALLSPSKS